MNSTHACAVRFVIHRCHSNARNVQGQIGFVAINLVGEPLQVPGGPSAASSVGWSAAQDARLQASVWNGMSRLPPGRGGGGAHPTSATFAMGPSGRQHFDQLQAAAMTAPMMHQQPPQQQAQFQHQVQQPSQQQQQQQQGPSAGRRSSLSASPDAASLALELGIDVVTAGKVLELQRLKQLAIDAEDYDEAKRLKGCTDRLRAVGGKVAQLEARKLAAVESEDYDLAKTLKSEIERLRTRAHAAAMTEDGGVQGSPVAEALATLPAAVATRATNGSVKAKAKASSAGAAKGSASTPPRGASSSVPPSFDWQDHDNRPAQAKGAYVLADTFNADSAPPNSEPPAPLSVVQRPGGTLARLPSDADDAGPPPAGFPADLPPPEPLSSSDAKDVGPLTDLLGLYLARCAYSRTWQLREAALAMLAKALASDAGLGSLPGSGATVAADAAHRGEAVRSLARLVGKGLKDRVAAVFSAAAGALKALVAEQVGLRMFLICSFHVQPNFLCLY
jgi:hypothetical protein